MKRKLLLVSGNLKSDDTKYYTQWTRCLGHEIHVMRIIKVMMILL